MYVVRIVGPSGREQYLCRGREVEYRNATRYSHPSDARRAADRYVQTRRLIATLVDIHDPEREVQ